VGWLEALVWPEQVDRLARLRAAIKIASEQRPRLVKGDLRADLAALAREAPKDVTRVIFHTAVLPDVCLIFPRKSSRDRLDCSAILDRERNAASVP
jgi:hypothetical protein